MESNSTTNSIDSLVARARALIAQKRWHEAGEVLEPLVRQEPRWSEGLLLLAQVDYQRGRWAESFHHVRTAIGLEPNQPEGYSLLGHVLRKSGHFSEAADAYHACLELKPDHLTALLSLGILSRDQRQTGQARQYFERALCACPGDPNILNNLAMVLCDVGRTRESIHLLEEALRIHPAAHETHSNLLLTLHYDAAIPPERLAEEHRRWAMNHASGIPRMQSTIDRTPERRLRLGFVSADFKNHPVGRLMEALWPRLDRRRVEILAYDTGTARDKVTAALQEQVTHWRSLVGLSDDAAAELVRSDQIDVLVDLSGHTASNRLLVFARKPAPIQVTWFAYPNTTGLKTVDYRITDVFADPVGARESRYAERLLRFENIAWQYRPSISDLPIQPLPHTRGKPFTFGCLNNPAKVSEATWLAWMEILRAVPAARLLLLVRDDSEFIASLERRWHDSGLKAEQLRCVQSAAPRHFMAYHYEVDLILDPFPYNGAVTTADALWMGVPVLSLAGDSYVSRQGVAVLSQVGLREWIADSVRDYIQKAIGAVDQSESLHSLNQELRTRLERSPLMDHDRFAREFETRLREVWRNHCAVTVSA